MTETELFALIFKYMLVPYALICVGASLIYRLMPAPKDGGPAWYAVVCEIMRKASLNAPNVPGIGGPK